jgi:hypothetical protein
MVALDALEAFALADPSPDPLVIQSGQRALFDELVANGNAWRVTDFVTLGSPLAHASILLAKDAGELKVKQQQRELPTCLPTLETGTEEHQRVSRFSFELNTAPYPEHRVPHHGAVFGPTRWTNLYFPNRNLVVGDLIGGPLQPVFGTGVRDVPVTTTQRNGRFSHTLYWRIPDAASVAATRDEAEAPAVPVTGEESAPPHIVALREALDLTDNKATPVETHRRVQSSDIVDPVL